MTFSIVLIYIHRIKIKITSLFVVVRLKLARDFLERQGPPLG